MHDPTSGGALILLGLNNVVCLSDTWEHKYLSGSDEKLTSSRVL